MTQKEHAYIYVIVRNDISAAQQCVQACHASIEAARNFVKPDEEHPYLVLCVCKSEHRLEKLMDQLKEESIDYRVFSDAAVSDEDKKEYTAIATEPLVGERREFFKHYQLLKGYYN